MQLNVKVERVIYPLMVDTKSDAKNNGNDFYVLGTNHGVVKGCVKWRPAEGELLTLEGQHVVYKGEKVFKFTAARLNLPIDAKARLMYAAERTLGIGPVMAAAIWERFGENWAEVDSAQIPHMAKKVELELKQTAAALANDQAKADTFAWLMEKGCTIELAAAAWGEWEGDAMGVVNKDCYRLADLPHFSFINIDQKVRPSFGIGDDDPRRVRAAVTYSLGQLTSSGSTVVEWWRLESEAMRNLGLPAERVAEVVKEMFEAGELKKFPGRKLVALPRHYDAEMAIWNYIMAADAA